MNLCFSEGSTAEVSQEEEASGNAIFEKSNGLELDILDNSNASTPRAHQVEFTTVEDDADEDEDEDEDITEKIDDQVENIGSNENEAPTSERAASGVNESPPVGNQRVKFENIKEEDSCSPLHSEEPIDDDRKERRHK